MFSWIFKSINVRKRIQSRNKEDEMVLSSSKGQMEVEFISGTQLAGSCGPAPSCGVGGLALHPLGTAFRTPWVYARRIGGGLGQMVITSLPSGRSWRECLLSSRGRRNLPSEMFVVSLCFWKHLPCQFISNPAAQCCRPNRAGNQQGHGQWRSSFQAVRFFSPPRGRFFPHCLIHLYSKRISFHHEWCTRSSFQYLHCSECMRMLATDPQIHSHYLCKYWFYPFGYRLSSTGSTMT